MRFPGHLLLILLLGTVFIAEPGSNRLWAQRPNAKGLKIEVQNRWPYRDSGYYRIQVRISTNPPVAATETRRFNVVMSERGYRNQPQLVTSTPLVLEVGKVSGSADLVFPVNGNAVNYNWNSCQLHIESDGDLQFERGDLFSTTLYLGSQNPSVLPTLLFVSSQITRPASHSFLRMKNQTLDLGAQDIQVTNTKLPSFQQLNSIYGGGIGNQTQTLSPNFGTIQTTLQARPAAQSNQVAAFSSAEIEGVPLDQLPSSWMGLSSVQVLLISVGDLVEVKQKHPLGFESLQRWCAAGGSLVVFDCGNQFERVSEVLQSLGTPAGPEWKLPRPLVARMKDFLVEVSNEADYYGRQEIDTGLAKRDLLLDRQDSQKFEKLTRLSELSSATTKAGVEFAISRNLLGRIGVVKSDMSGWNKEQWQQLMNSLSVENRSLRDRVGTSLNSTTPNVNFSIAGVGRPPRIAFLILIVVFVYLVGPFSYRMLKKGSRLQLMFLTVPLLSATACAGLLVYSVLADGIHVQGRVRSFSALDQASNRLVSFARHSQYSGFQPSPYQFPRDHMVGVTRSYLNPRTALVEQVDSKSISGGDIRPRMPHQLTAVHSSETQQQLVLFEPAAEGASPAIRNEFNSPVRLAIVRTEQGYFRFENVGPQQNATGEPISIREAATLISKLLKQQSPAIEDEFLSHRQYRNDYYYINRAFLDSNDSKIDVDFHFSRLRSGSQLGNYFDSANSYIAIFDQFDLIQTPQEGIVYSDQVHIVHGKW